MATQCWICKKAVYAADPQLIINGKVHKSCCKCSDCGKQLTPNNAFSVTKDGNKVLVCDQHNRARLLPPSDTFKKQEDSVPQMSMISPAMMRAAAAAEEKAKSPPPAAAASPPAAAVAATTTDDSSSSAAPTTPTPPPPPSSTTSLAQIVESLKQSSGDARLANFANLVVMSGSGENKMAMAAKDLGLVDLMVSIIKEDTGEARMAAAGVLWNLSVAAENRQTLCQSPDLIPALVRVLGEDKGESRLRAFGVLHNLSLSPENQELMGTSELGLLPALLSILHESNVDSIDKACNVLWNLSVCEKNRPSMASTDLVSVLSSLIVDSEPVRAKAFIVLYYLTLSGENRVLMGSAPGLLAALAFMLQGDKGDMRVKSCGMLVNLTSANENKPLIAAPSTGLLPLIIKAVAEEPGDLRTKACSVLWNLSVSPENRTVLTAPELGLLPALVSILTTDTSDSRVKASVVVQNLAGAADNQTPMVDPSLGLVSALAKVILEDQTDAKAKALGAVLNLCISTPAPENQFAIATAPGLVAALAFVIREDAGDPRSRACGVLQNLAVTEANRVPILSPELNTLDLLQVVGNVIKSDKDSAVNCMGLLLNLSVAPENKLTMAESFTMLDAVVGLIKDGEGEAKLRAVNLVCSLMVAEPNRLLLRDFNGGAIVVVLSEAAKTQTDATQAKALSALSMLAPGLVL